jgi:DNA-binding IclR family transcriptional regulator
VFPLARRGEGTVAAADAQAGVERVARVFDVLELLVTHRDGMTLTEIVKRLGLPTSSTHNLLQRMVVIDAVSITDDLRYTVGPRAMRLGIRIVDTIELRTLARRWLQDLARATGDDVYLAVRSGTRVFYVDKVAGSRPVTVDIRMGQRLYLHATAVGKLFAANNAVVYRRLKSSTRTRFTPATLVDEQELDAELTRIRRDGYSVSREEAIPGIVGIAVPVRDAYGELAGAIHVSAPVTELDGEREHEVLAASRTAAAAIERELGRSDPSAEAGA